jgi:hypothetical protein
VNVPAALGVPRPVRIRSMLPSDVGFVVDSWTQESARTGRYESTRRRTLALDGVRRLARHAVSTSTVLVACSASSESTLIGWVCGAGGEPFAVFVRWDFRHRGIGRALTSALRESA